MVWPKKYQSVKNVPSRFGSEENKKGVKENDAMT